MMHAIWGQAFRPFFMFGALFAAIAIGAWGLLLNGSLQLSPYGNVMFWHQHEMIFGFVAAIIVGFLLTAVQNWTGLRATHGWALAGLFGIWLAGRVAMLLTPWLPLWLIAVIDLTFLPLAAFMFASLVVRAGNRRNLFLIAVLLLLWLCNLLMHLGVLLGQFMWIQHGALAAVFVITLIMLVISGRVLPMFTANGTQTQRVHPWPLLDMAVLALAWLITMVFVLNQQQQIPAAVLSGLFAFASVLSAWRVLRVRSWITWRVPLLWSLHLAVLCIPVGFALFAFRYAGFAIPQTAAVHALTAGAMGVMIIAMMARVALGHSGRPLQPHPLMSAAFALVALAAVLRMLAGWVLPEPSLLWLNISVISWVLGYIVYLIIYTPIFVTPRADGKAG